MPKTTKLLETALRFLQNVFRRWLTASRSKRLLYIAPWTAGVFYGIKFALEGGAGRMLRLFFDY